MMKKAELNRLIKQEGIMMKEQEAKNKYNHKFCLALKKKLNKTNSEFKEVNDKFANITRKIEQASNVERDYANRLAKAEGFLI